MSSKTIEECLILDHGRRVPNTFLIDNSRLAPRWLGLIPQRNELIDDRLFVITLQDDLVVGQPAPGAKIGSKLLEQCFEVRRLWIQIRDDGRPVAAAFLTPHARVLVARTADLTGGIPRAGAVVGRQAAVGACDRSFERCAVKEAGHVKGYGRSVPLTSSSRSVC